MTSGGIPIKRSLNAAVYPQQLITGSAYFWNNVPVSQVILPQSNVERTLNRVVLYTSLTSSDMVSTVYWDGQTVQAPFYLFLGTTGLSNIQDLTQIGNLNVGEWFTPIRIQPNTDLIGIWLGVLAASAFKCLASFYCEVY